MKNLQSFIVVAVGLVLFSSCARGYGCPYSSAPTKEIKCHTLEEVACTDRQKVTNIISSEIPFYLIVKS